GVPHALHGLPEGAAAAASIAGLSRNWISGAADNGEILFLTVHPRGRFACANYLGFLCSQFCQSLMDSVLWLKVLSESHVRAMVTGFGFKQAAVKVGQFSIREPVAQE